MDYNNEFIHKCLRLRGVWLRSVPHLVQTLQMCMIACAVLLVVDCFTRTLWCRQQVNLEAETTWRAYNDIVESSGRKPRVLWTDSGKSFTGKYYTSRLEAEGTTLIHRFGPAQSAFAEAANKTVGRRVYQKMTEINTEDWGPLMQECVDEIQRYQAQRAGHVARRSIGL